MAKGHTASFHNNGHNGRRRLTMPSRLPNAW
ncbi:hypothetical protein CMUS01_16729 [Colletotrichum musicola]|uniref:Uncharacterized protein n=1 Tax=Colletotrichum musicola TaxID=2175873 RepID=A0A8H6MHY4_9PEZI|nr:hypothetical protein CMUS01_16729 [Colletotrichum musicola]